MQRVPAGDRVYLGMITLAALVIPALLVTFAVVILRAAWPAISSDAWSFVTGTTWDIAGRRFGALPAIAGTVLTSAIALLIAGPIAITIAIFTSELAPVRLRAPAAFLVDLLAAVPTVAYGLWGSAVLVPFLRDVVVPLGRSVPVLDGLFSAPAYGTSLLAAALLLAIMIIPFIASVSREVLIAVPRAQREAALALGANRWEVVRDAVIPYARSGLVGGVMLGLGRALGETIAVAMVIGNRHGMPTSLLDPAHSLASILAIEFGEASDPLHLSALMALAGLLFVITLLVNLVARWLVSRVRRERMFAELLR